MINQIKRKQVILTVIGILAISVVVFGIINNPQKSYENSTNSNLENINKYRKTWNAIFTSWSGKAAPDFIFNDIEGNQHRLSDYKDKKILIVFWATWCPACNMEIPHLVNLRKKYSEDKLVILAISNEPIERLQQFAAAKDINYKLVSPGNNILPAPFSNVRAIPTSFFIDEKGIIKLATEGLVSLEEKETILQIK